MKRSMAKTLSFLRAEGEGKVTLKKPGQLFTC